MNRSSNRPWRAGAAEPEEGRLIAASRGGDADAFGVLASRHRRRIAAVVLSLLHEPAETEDVVQDALLAAFQQLDRLRDPTRFGSWLRAIALNHARMHLRSRQRELGLHRLLLDAGLTGGPTNVQESDGDRLALLRHALARLTSAQREVVLARHLDGLSCVEIARREGTTAGAIRVRLHRALSRLRLELHNVAPRHQEVVTMVEMELYDVLVRVEPSTTQNALLAAPQAIVLRERDGERALPMFVGSSEAGALALHRAGAQPPRPLTVELLENVVRVLDAPVDHAVVTALREGTFYGVVRIAGHDLDARPSDAVNIAARVGAPILVEEAVLDEASVSVDELPEALDSKLSAVRETEGPPDWRSLTPELVLEAWRPWRQPGKP